METVIIKQKTAKEISLELAGRVRKRRKEAGLTQAELARRSGVSLGSLKRFETGGEIALLSLARIAVALGCEEDFDGLFAQKKFRSIEEIINGQD